MTLVRRDLSGLQIPVSMEEGVVDTRLSRNEFSKLTSFVFEHSGINLPFGKKALLEGRLQKRLRALNIRTYHKYIEYLLSSDGLRDEMIHMIDVVTTNKTDFFREPHHFDFLRDSVLPQLVKRGQKRVNIWSAACSTGEEPYTIAMIVQEFVNYSPGFEYDIFASDISTHVLNKAMTAVYPAAHAERIAFELRQSYLLKSKDRQKPTVRVVPALRSKVSFSRVNLTDQTLDVAEMFDVIFCRNALIYFDRDTQCQVIKKLLSKLAPEGYLIIGHSESLHYLDLPVSQIRPTIYVKK